MLIYLAGNMSTESREEKTLREKEEAVITQVTESDVDQYNRLVSFFYKREANNIITIKGETINGTKKSKKLERRNGAKGKQKKAG